MIVEYIENIFDDNFNSTLSQELLDSKLWAISKDNVGDDTNGIFGKLSDKYSDSGLLILSLSETGNVPPIERLNVSAYYIYRSIIKNSKYNFINASVKRVLWNYYNRSSHGVTHTDSPQSNYYSILYNINDNDGATVINDERIDAKAGSCVIFKSNSIHCGVGPTKAKNKLAVNIIFSADGHELKNE